MIVFVNRRPVDSRTLNYALIESYHESLPKGRYPLAFVFFECDPAAVDVNVHPAKREVRFRSDPAVRSFVIRAVLARLRELNAPATATAGPGAPSAEPPRPAAVAPAISISPPITPPQLPSPVVPTVSPPALRHPSVPAVPAVPPAVVHRPELPAPDWHFIGLAHGNFALFETAAGLVLLDRRAAHERVWFERLQAQFRDGTVPGQQLLLPVPVELDPIATALLLERMELLQDCGLAVAEFGRNFFRIEAVPVWMEPGDAEPFLRDLLGRLREGLNPDVAREEIARLAATKAVRLPEAPGETELRALVGQLFATRHPLTSPAGRPTFIEVNHAELARRFQKLA
jgi:DNA mismatch repair protein MutL